MPKPTSNTFSDFPPDQFEIIAFCESCGHRAALDRAKVPDGQIVQDLPKRLRCTTCGARKASIRLVYIGAGEYRHG